MSPSLKTGKKPKKMPPRAQAGRRSAGPAPRPAVPWGFSAEDNGPGEQRVGERWGDFSQQHFGDAPAATLALHPGLVSILLLAEHFIDKKWLLAKVLLCFGWNFLSSWAKMRRVLIFLSVILLLFRKNGS